MLSRRATFVVASASLIWTFFASGTPVPLYNTYRAENGLTSADLVLTTVVYLASTAAALLVLGRLSDHLGRRPIAALALASSLAGALVLMHVEAVGWLVAGRVLQGVACVLYSVSSAELNFPTRDLLRYIFLNTNSIFLKFPEEN